MKKAALRRLALEVLLGLASQVGSVRPVILSAAKNLPLSPHFTEILRCAQDDWVSRERALDRFRIVPRLRFGLVWLVRTPG
jgi:hypothetical protein